MPESQDRPIRELILGLCKDTLKQAGFDSGFLNMAFRRQCILHNDEWNQLQAPNPSDRLIEQFAQRIVNEILQTKQENWGIKLIKRNYLCQLESALSSNRAAYDLLSKVQSIQKAESKELKETKEEPTPLYLEALRAEATYVDSLMDLPFRLEKMLLTLVNTTGANYQPKKSAAVLAMTLDTICQGLELSEVSLHNHLQVGLKLAIDVAMPQLLGEYSVLELESLLSSIKDIIANHKKVNAAKAQLFTKDCHGKLTDEALAHKQLLASMNLHFESLDVILQKTLLEPVSQLTQTYVDAYGVVEAVTLLAQDNNFANHLMHISTAFKQLDKIYLSCHALDSSLLPLWVQEADAYYQSMKTNVANVAESMASHFSSLYDYAFDFIIPEAMRPYLSSASSSSLSALLKEIDDEDATQNIERVIAYYSFYELVRNAKINDALKPIFFNKYMKAAHKINNKLKGEDEDYAHYLILEDQFSRKLSNNSLSERMVNGRALLRTETVAAALLKANMSDITPEKIHALSLIHHLQTIESKFDPKAPILAFKELLASVVNITYKPVFIDKFLKPAMQRLVSRYQQETFIPLLEQVLDNKLMINKQIKIRKLYVKLKEGFNLSHQDKKLIIDILSNARGLGVDIEKINVELNFLMSVIDKLPEVEFVKTANYLEVKSAPKESKGNTPKEVQKDNASKLVNDYVIAFKPLLEVLDSRLEEQLNACQKIMDLLHTEGETDSEIALICASKIAYIEAIQAFINEFDDAFGDFNPTLVKLLTGEHPLLSFEGLELQRKALNLDTLPGKMLNFIGLAHPNETFFRNLINYYLNDTNLKTILDAQTVYSERLKKHPIPAALMSVLADPLTVENLVPSKEKIMDEVVDKLLEQGISSGLGVLKQAVGRLSSAYFLKALPYPFLAELTLQVINSDPVQTQINNALNSLVTTYGYYLGNATKEFKEQAKMKLYPMLNIAIQKTIQADAFLYAKNPQDAGETLRDAFSIYFLQYWELKCDKPNLNKDAVIAYLFGDLLKDERDRNAMIQSIRAAFESLEQKINPIMEVDLAKKDTNDQLAFLIEHVDFNEPEQDTLIKLALINRLILVLMKAGDEVGKGELQSLLQEGLVAQLSALLERAHDAFIKVPPMEFKEALLEEKVDPSEHKATYVAIQRALSGNVNTLITKHQLKRIAERLNTSFTLAQDGVDERQLMMDKPKFLGTNLATWEFNESPRSRKIVYGLKILGEVASFALLWLGIITCLVAATGIGMILTAALLNAVATILAPVGLIRFGVKLFMEVFNNKLEYNQAMENASLVKKIGLFFRFSFKYLSTALVKTFFSDYLALKWYILKAPLQRVLNAASYHWPKVETIRDERDAFIAVRDRLKDLRTLIAQQQQFIDKEPSSLNQSEAITETVRILMGAISKASLQLEKARENEGSDARFYKDNYGVRLSNYHDNFEQLKKELNSFLKLQASQNKFFTEKKSEEDLSLPPKLETLIIEVKPVPVDIVAAPELAVVVSLEAYRKKQAQKIQVQPEVLPSPPENKTEVAASGISAYLYATIWWTNTPTPESADPAKPAITVSA